MRENMLKLGVMQGRLTNKDGFFPQRFPWDNWQEEFSLAGNIGFDCLEWMFNSDRWEDNPIVTEKGLSNIQKCISDTGIYVSGICANYFMDHCIYDSSAVVKEKNIYILNMLVKNAEEIECPNVILPMFEKSGALFEKEAFWEEMCLLCNEIKLDNVHILIETDAPIHVVRRFLEQSPDTQISMCYDLGNAAGLGKNILHELQSHSNLIGEYHLKDKKRGESSVMLGEGDVPYKECMDWFVEYENKAILILESYYGLNAVEDTKKNFLFIKDQMGR